MAKKLQRARTPARIIWNIIEAEMHRQKITQEELASRVKTSRVTVCSDGRDPEKIPLYRMWLYFAALGIDTEKVLRPLAMEHAENLIRR